MKRPRRTETSEAPRSQGATTENIGQYLREEQRSERGCIGRRMQRAFHHGLLGLMPPPLSAVHKRIVSCNTCERLRTHCARIAREKKAAHRDDVYWGKPVPGFGDPDARMLVLGLAPAAHGANRTGRVFTGDGSGDFLMRAMHAAGFASIPTSQRIDDGLKLSGAYIAAAVRCAPPDNKPSVEEIAACHPHLVAEVAALPRLRIIVALGKIGFDAAWRVLAERGVRIRPKPLFGHGLLYQPDRGPAVIASYHPSRQNTNTRKLTPEMLAEVFHAARFFLFP